jgi:uncharacterized oligopeptide transporter (OPT) family protein
MRMPCLLFLVVLLFPRVVLIVMYLTSNYLQRVYHELLIPILGFLFLPLTTITYAWLVNSHLPLSGVYVIVLIVAVIIDIGGWGGGEYHRRRW